MNTTALKLSAIALLLSACSFHPAEQEIKIQPLSQQEIQAVQLSLQTGQPLDAIKIRDTQEACSVAPFFGMNVEDHITVPEDYSQPNGRQIQVYYYGRLKPGKDPIVFFNGGPASDSHSSSALLEDFIRNPEAQKLSFIYIDQRGTGCSDVFPSEPTAETVDRLTHYTSTEIVKDSEAIRTKLLGANSKWKIFGQSYGGLIVHRYAMVAPDSIQGAFAHGFSLMKDQAEWLKLRVKSQKRVSEIYFQKYPTDRDTLAKIHGLIAETLCFNDGGTKVCGPKVMDALTILLGFSNSWDSLHAVVVSLISPDGKLQMPILERFVRNYVFGVYNSNALAGSVISMTEISGGDSDADTCKAAQEKLKSEGEDPEHWSINECRLLAGMQNDQWNELLKDLKTKFQMTPEMMLTTLNQHPNLPFFLYSGEKDVFVPIETFQEEKTLLAGKIKYQQFPNTGHEGFYAEKQVWADILANH